MGRQHIVAVIFASCLLTVRGVATELSPDQWQFDAKDVHPATSVRLTLRAQHEVKGWLSSGRPVLTIQCKSGTAASYVEAGVALEVTQVDQQVVRVRFDDLEFHPERWREVGNWTISSRHPDRLIEQLLRSQRFTLEFTPFGSAPVQADFAVQGLAQFSAPLATACGTHAPGKGAAPQRDP